MNTTATSVNINTYYNGAGNGENVVHSAFMDNHRVAYGTTTAGGVQAGGSLNKPKHNPSQKLKEMLLWMWRRLNVPYHERQRWNNAMEGVLSHIGYIVGLGNMWRFPYYCYKYGGATFLIPYGICLLLIGVPEYFVDVSLAQYMSLGPTNVYANMAPLFKGLGWAMVATSLMVAIYYNVIIAWALVYLYSSWQSPLPWTHCTNPFNTPACLVHGQNNSYKAAEEYFTYYVLRAEHINSTNSETSHSVFHPGLVLSLFVSWLLVFLCLYRGIRSYGKVAYVSVIFPYIILITLLGWSYTQFETEAWKESINKYFSPTEVNATQLTDTGMWVDAATQVLFTLGAGFGGHATLSSYNKLEQNTLLNSCFIVMWDTATSFLCGSVVFTSLGLLASEMEEDVSSVFNNSTNLGTVGVELVFITYPILLGRIDTNSWSIIFFLMILALSVDSMMGFVVTLVTAIFDNFQTLRKHYFTLKILLCFLLFLLGLPMCTKYGIHIVELLHMYTCKLLIIIICLIKILVLSYVYGLSKFIQLVENDLNVYIPLPVKWYLRFTLMVFGPVIFAGMFTMLVWSVGFGEDHVQWNGEEIPYLCRALSWALTFAICLIVPVMAIHELYKNRRKNWRVALKPTANFLPKYVRQEEQPQTHVLQELNSRR